jgi:hypothetical protein
VNFKIHRNDPCPCNSGMKYKKCCLLSTSSVDLDPSFVGGDEFNEADFQDGRELSSEAMIGELTDLYLQLQMLESFSKEKRAQFFKRLHEFHEQYPKNPVIVNYLYNAYRLINDKTKAHSYMLETYEKFPQYFFGRLIYAIQCLEDKQYEKAFEVLAKYDSLKDLYPERKKFHVTEGYNFHAFLVEYHVALENRILAEQHYNSLVQLASSYPTSDSAKIIENAREQIELIGFNKTIERLLKIK